ncbi:MAG: apolipoprotein N-acyltransferase [Spirochaetes bacterium]|nr:apolipoprotein N-acyltransferase [Spirochaetota bacterium]
MIVSAIGGYLALLSPLRADSFSLGDLFYLTVIAVHLVWGGALLAFPERLAERKRILPLRAPEFLFGYSFLLFWILYAFASNANMDYVQRFMESGGELTLALDTATERLQVVVRFLPFLLITLLHYAVSRLQRPQHADAALLPTPSAFFGGTAGSTQDTKWRRSLRRWALPLALLSSAFSGFALPSFLAEGGVWILGWVAMVPLFLVFAVTGFWGGVLYGLVYGLFRTVLTNYWLATFSLVSLQFAVLVFLFFYGVFLPVLMLLYHRLPRLWLLILPLSWSAFELFRSTGFLGYPWALTAHSQYSVVPLLQLASVTGVWGVSFLVILVNAILAYALIRRLDRQGTPWLLLGGTAAGIFALGYLGAVAMSFGDARDAVPSEDGGRETAQVALVQQNSDPRKHDYSRTFESLRNLTNEAVEANPDLVVWPETAFVPNIRRWGAEDAGSSRYVRLVRRFLDYQESTGTWLLTGNDDYELVRDDEGNEVDRLNYNAAVLFDAEGSRVETYRKIKLVPFTEYFPYQETLPWVYQLLLEFDTHFWEPGTERTIFEHPKFTFSTPICFEDVFPGQVRKFVRAGAEVIANISNDYWSLTPVQAQQHFVAGIFRSIENRRPVVRATTSGITAHVDRFGRIRKTAPTYSEEYVIADVTIPPDRFTLYTRWGDWFPLFSAGVVLLLFVASFFRRRTD